MKAAALMPLTARRLRTLEAIAEQLAEQLNRPTLSPAAALGLMVDCGPEALAALAREHALEAARPKPAPPDPDAWPLAASREAVLLYRRAVRELLEVDEAFAATSPDALAWPWRCSTCRATYRTAPDGTRRRWWECPTCAPSLKIRRKVGALRRAWSWPDAEARVEQQRADRARVREEATIRATLARARRVVGARRPALEALACEAAGLELLPREPHAESDDWQRFACRKCRAEWRPFDVPEPDHRGEPWIHVSECRAPLTWWECPKGCNARARARVLRLAGRRLERAWLGRVDVATAARLSGCLA